MNSYRETVEKRGKGDKRRVPDIPPGVGDPIVAGGVAQRGSQVTRPEGGGGCGTRSQ